MHDESTTPPSQAATPAEPHEFSKADWWTLTALGIMVAAWVAYGLATDRGAFYWWLPVTLPALIALAYLPLLPVLAAIAVALVAFAFLGPLGFVLALAVLYLLLRR